MNDPYEESPLFGLEETHGMPWWALSNFWIRVIQIAIFLTVSFSSVHFEQSTGYHINPFIIGAWSFMASYGFTLAYVNLLERRVRLGRVLPRLRRKSRPDITM